MGYKVSKTDVVKFNGSRIKSEKLRYVLLNKPKNFSSRNDNSDKIYSVNRLVEKACKERIYPVDKLNKTDTGLLLFTNDVETTSIWHNALKDEMGKKVYEIGERAS